MTQNMDRKWMLPLCISHGAAAWGERSWEFGAGLLLLEHSNQNLRLTATLELISYTSIVLLGSRIGLLTERGSLLRNAVGTLGLQNLALMAAAGTMCIRGSNVAISSSIFCSVIARLASLASSIVTEKQWTKALADSSGKFAFIPIEQEGEQQHEEEEEGTSQMLTRINAQLRAIDLMCNLMAPMAVGFLLEYTTPSITSLGIAAFNLVAWPIEVACLLWISRTYRIIETTECYETGESLEWDEKKEGDNKEESEERQDNGLEEQEEQTKSPLKVYFSQPILGSALALAVLYLTVISFGSLMTAWLVSLDFRESHVAIGRALSALTGILATRIPVKGITAIWLMWISLLPTALVAPFVSQHKDLLWIIMASVILSRFGLWGFDLCVTKMLQNVENIGITNGVQASLQSVFAALTALACIAWPHPYQFIYLIEISFGSVTTAALLHTLWWKCRR